MTMIHPGTYSQFTEELPTIQEVQGTIGFIPFLSEAYIDNELLFAGSLNLDIFGKKNKKKFTQGLYNAKNFHEISTWLYVMRVLPAIEDMIQYDSNIPETEKYRHPKAGQTVAYVNGSDDTGIVIDENQSLFAPSFAHTVFGYVTGVDDDNNPIQVGAIQRYFNPLYGVDENPDNLLYLDEQFGVLSKFIAKSILTDSIELEYNPYREVTNDNITAAPTSMSNLDVAALIDPANGYTDKYWPGINEQSSYYYNFNPSPDSFRPLFTIYGIGRGPYYNKIKVQLIPKVTQPGVWILTTLTFDKRVNTFVKLGPEFEVSFDPSARDVDDESMYIADVINKQSDYIRIHVYGKNLKEAMEKPAPGTTGKTIFEKVTEFLYNYDPSTDLYAKPRQMLELRNGSYGGLYIDNSLDRNTYNNAMRSALSGDYDAKVTNIYKNDISVIFDNDSTVEYKEAIQELCMKRQDCFGYLDLPKSVDPEDGVNTRNTKLVNISEWCVGIFGNHTLIYSSDEGRDIWVAPSYHLSYLVPLTDINGYLWNATAGLKRGDLKECKQTQYDLNDTDYDRWYLNQINPIIEKMNVIHVGGQLTAQRFQSAKSNINIVRLLLYVSKTLRKFGEWYIFDNLTPKLLSSIETEIKSFLKEIQLKGGIQGFKCSVTSTPYEMKRKIATANIEIDPTYVLEKLLFNIGISGNN